MTIRLLLEPGESMEIGADGLLDDGVTLDEIEALARENDCEVEIKDWSRDVYTFRRLESGREN